MIKDKAITQIIKYELIGCSFKVLYENESQNDNLLFDRSPITQKLDYILKIIVYYELYMNLRLDMKANLLF